MASLRNKVVIITGPSSGIGKAAATEFARRGASVVLAARREERLRELCETIVRQYQTPCLPVPADVTSEDAVEHLFAAALERFGRVDILINNAGRGLKCRVEDMSLADWHALMETNATSVFLCSRKAVQVMSAAKTPGHIITISSIAGRFGGPDYAAYCASKHAVSGFMKSLGWEARRYGIKCDTIHPARIDTEFFDIYQQRPSRGQMLTPRDFVDFVIAVAERNPAKQAAVFALNIAKRLWYMLRYR